MDKLNRLGRINLLLAVALLVVARVSPLRAQGLPADKGPSGVMRLTLDDIKQRVLADNKLLQLAALNVQSKDYAARAMQANFFPQIIGQSVYMHFNDDLGTVLTTQGRTVRGPRGRPASSSKS
jgi:outer membrane protein TolC